MRNKWGGGELFAAHQLKSQTNGLKPFEWNNSGKISLDQLKIKESSKDIQKQNRSHFNFAKYFPVFFYCTSICVFKIKEIKCIKINEISNRFIPN